MPLVTTLIVAQDKTRRLSQAALIDKIKGGWAGQMIGVSFGAPTVFKSGGKIIEGELKWTPERIDIAMDARARAEEEIGDLSRVLPGGA
jgi:hypothetical protein